MVGLIIAFPNLVSGGLSKAAEVDSSNVQIEAQPQDNSGIEMDGNKLFGPADAPASAASSTAAEKSVDPLESAAEASKK
jgi:hypothetical protein